MNRNAVLFVFLCIATVVCVILRTPWLSTAAANLNVVWQDAPNSSHQRINIIKITSWTQKYRSHSGPWFAEGTSAFSECSLPPGTMCEYAHNSTEAAYNSSDAVLFVGNLLRSPMPQWRAPEQNWIFAQHESPVRAWSMEPAGIKQYAKYFNVSMTYSRNADVLFNYGSCVEKTSGGEQTAVQNYAANKTELVAWFVSNCHPPSEREKYVSELQKFIPVHIYGECGKYECGRTCGKLLQKKYKFYLAFENSFCEDYITEKFWKCFELGIVPVVLGGGDYYSVAPAHSFIDVKDFNSPKHLAEYLRYLGTNDNLYNQYFSWKKTHLCRQGNQYLCQLCRLLHERKMSGRTFPPLDLNQLWSKSYCTSSNDFRERCNCWPRKHQKA